MKNQLPFLGHIDAHIALVVTPLALITIQSFCSDLGYLHRMLVIPRVVMNFIVSYKVSLLDMRMNSKHLVLLATKILLIISGVLRVKLFIELIIQ